jgi:hypothetical protein
MDEFEYIFLVALLLGYTPFDICMFFFELGCESGHACARAQQEREWSSAMAGY